jgi:hypothetical protein
MIRDLMAESIERRFRTDALRAPHAVEWLSDNGLIDVNYFYWPCCLTSECYPVASAKS